MSPSSRREWIEINHVPPDVKPHASPSSRREWIEIICINCEVIKWQQSPSSRREWIEIKSLRHLRVQHMVSLLAEGVD